MDAKHFTQRAQPIVLANKKFNKLFCVGYNKTGTTTLETVLRLYGYRLPVQQEQEILLTKQVFETNYRPLLDFASQYDVFQDLPFSQGNTYVAADALFPNSKFILTERNSEEWFKSLCSFHSKVFNVPDLNKLTKNELKKKFTYLYSGYSFANNERLLTCFEAGKSEASVRWDLLYDKDFYIERYERRNEEIKRYFANSDGKLLVIDITKELDTSKVCKFLGIPSDFVIDMPHSNKT